MTGKPAWICAVLAVSVATLACERQQARAPNPPPVVTAAPLLPEASVLRGAYLVKIAGCDDCHTPGGLFGAPDHGRRLSGSELGWRGPWGLTFPRNLTPDMETGLGRWSEDEIVYALRNGRRPDGTPLLPPMPWPLYAAMTDTDAHSVAMFLKSLPSVVHARPSPDVADKLPALVFPAPPVWDVPQRPAGAQEPAAPQP